MILRLTDEEVDLVKDALVAYTRVLDEKARPLCTGYSPEGITLCCRRLEAEALAADIRNRQPGLFLVEPANSRATARPAAVTKRAA